MVTEVSPKVLLLGEAMAWSESIKASEVEFFLDYLLERGWIKGQRQGHGMGHFSVTIDGYSHIADVSINRDLSQAFVAMWFDGKLERGLRQRDQASDRAGRNMTPSKSMRNPMWTKLTMR